MKYMFKYKTNIFTYFRMNTWNLTDCMILLTSETSLQTRHPVHTIHIIINSLFIINTCRNNNVSFSTRSLRWNSESSKRKLQTRINESICSWFYLPICSNQFLSVKTVGLQWKKWTKYVTRILQWRTYETFLGRKNIKYLTLKSLKCKRPIAIGNSDLILNMTRITRKYKYCENR